MAAPNRPSDEVLEFIRIYFRYDPETGVLERFNRKTGMWKEVKLTKGYDTTRGAHRNPCVVVTISGKQYGLQVTNVCWYLHHKAWPTKEIHHIDIDPFNNKITNLEPSNRAAQIINQHSNKTLLPGVFKTKSRPNPFRAKIKINNKSVHLGQYPTEIKAHEVYRAKYKEIYGEELVFPYLPWSKPTMTEIPLSDLSSEGLAAYQKYKAELATQDDASPSK